MAGSVKRGGSIHSFGMVLMVVVEVVVVVVIVVAAGVFVVE